MVFSILDTLDQYNVIWDSPSRNAAGSMPLGNGQIGVNVWAEPDGDVLFYVSATDAWDDNGRLLKLGRLRVGLTPNPFTASSPFRQTLDLRRGMIRFVAGQADVENTLTLWVDAYKPVIYLQIQGQIPLTVRVSLELWRMSERTLSAQEISYGDGMKRPGGLQEYPDTVMSQAEHRLDQAERIVWYHHNTHSRWPELTAAQGLEAADPLRDRIFGGMIEGSGLINADAQTLVSAHPQRNCLIALYPHTQQSGVVEWLAQLDRTRAALYTTSIETAAHERWWTEFWTQSWLQISGDNPDLVALTQAYLLQRFMFACSGRGAFPIKFNGSIFTVEPFMDAEYAESSLRPMLPYNADFRQWGSGYWFQKTRLPYWAMLHTGDFTLMKPFFKMYHDALPLAKARTRLYFGHDGAYFPETITAWGLYNPDDYDYARPETLAPGDLEGGYIRRYYCGILELVTLALDYFAFTQDRAFVTDTLLPLADAFLLFYAQHYPRDAHGKLRLFPSQTLETWWETVNPAPDIAGLHFVLAGLLSLPTDVLSAEQRAAWTQLQALLPPLAIIVKDGQRVIAPAEDVIDTMPHNAENCELYAVWPFRLYGVGKDDLNIGIATFETRMNKAWDGWQHGSIHAACLGLTEAAQNEVKLKYAARHPYYRFPIMWGTFDWIPDQDNGSVANIALQHMLLQYDGTRITLFPAWPLDWDVDFKLYAPLNTVIEGRYHKGVLETLTIVPISRAPDVVIAPNIKRGALTI